MTSRNFTQVGQNVIKVDGYGLVTGKAKYTDDFSLPGMLHAKVLYSPYAHARIRKIDTRKARALPGVHAVLTWQDVPRIPFTTAGQGAPEPSPYDTFILDNKVRFVGDNVAAVAAETPALAAEAVRLIKVEYEVLPPILDAREAMKPGAPVIHDEPEAHMPLPLAYDPKRNLAAHVEMQVGDVEQGLKDADYTFDHEYYSHYATHVAIEPHICITWFDENDRLVIRSSTQVPFHVRRLVARALELPVGRIRVIKPRIGGGFGGKQEILLEFIGAALTVATRRPVRFAYTRPEEFVSSRTRHPQHIRLRTGVKKDGTITAIDLKALMNTGAYGSHGLTVICNSGSKTLPLLKANTVKFWGDSVYTNLPVGGAYRGYGGTQAMLAMGIQFDEMAEKIGMDTLRFYQRNHIRSGEGSPVFQALGEGKEGVEQKIGACGLPECIEIGAREMDWFAKREQYARERARGGIHQRGVGMVCLMQGSSIPEIDMGAASLKMNEDGSFNLLMGATDLGTGSDTVLAQVAAEVLSVPTDKILAYSSDTDLTPFDVGAYASSTTYLSGAAVLKAAEKVKHQILEVAAGMLNEPKEKLRLEKGTVVGGKKPVGFNEIALHSLYEKNQFQIASHASHITHKSPPPFSAHFGEVEVNRRTGKVTLLKYVATVDCGTAINPRLAEGQIEGAVVNGLGFALCEEYLFDAAGRMLNPNLMFYKIYSTRDLPELKIILVPTYEESGPFGAKSVSEIGINGPLPVLSNAICHATGVRLREGPFTSEKVLAALTARR